MFFRVKNKSFGIWGIIALLFCMFPLSRQALAAEEEAVQFSVRALKSDKQIDKNVSYFDLLLLPGEEEVLEIDIFNTGNVPIQAAVSACTAGTNSGGVIDYDNIHATDDSLKIAFADIARVESPLVNVPAHSSARTRIRVKMPAESFDGILLGGIVIKKATDENAVSSPEVSGMSLKNEYCYVIGAKIQSNDSTVEPDFRLKYVKPALSNQRTSIAANLQNFQAAIVKGLDIDAKVYYNKGEQPAYSRTSTQFDVAPNSNFDYIIPCSGKLPAGDYRLSLRANDDERVWEFEESFTITSAEVTDINDNAVNIPAVNYYRLATIILAILLIIIIILIILRKIIIGAKKKREQQ